MTETIAAMQRRIQSIEWRRAGAEAPTNLTDAIEEGVVTATPHPHDAVDQPKGYTVKLTLKPDQSALAEQFQEALMDIDSPTVTLQLDGVEEPIRDVPVGVSKVPYPGEQNIAELSVKPDGHDAFHEHF
jgi:hypothetical protein